MQKTKQYILFILVACLTVVAANAQSLTSSPYSMYGLGDMHQKGFNRNKAMGNIGIALTSPTHLNVQNPASYCSMDSMTFIYEFGVNAKFTNLKTSTQKYASNNSNLNFIAIGFPITKFWASSIGLLPFSSMGYSIKTETINNDIGKIVNKYDGTGGINQFYIGNSIKLLKKLSLGVNASYLFGALAQYTSTAFPDNVNFFELNSQKKIKLNDFYFNFGLQYNDSIAHKYNYTIGLIFDNQSKISATSSIYTTNFLYSNSTGTIDTLINEEDKKGYVLLPTNMGFGFTISQNNSITFGVDYIRQNWADARFFNNNDSLVNSNYIGFGVEYIPDASAINKYSDRICYRFGGHYNNTYLKIKGNQINDYGISFGVGLPFRKTKTTFNAAFEIGTRGTTNSNLIKETYYGISLNISFFDNWFLRKRFD